MTTTKFFVFCCPRCSRTYISTSSMDEAEETTKEHVSLAHPEYDPYWADDD